MAAHGRTHPAVYAEAGDYLAVERCVPGVDEAGEERKSGVRYVIETNGPDGRTMRFATSSKDDAMMLASLLTKCESLEGVEVYSTDKGFNGSEERREARRTLLNEWYDECCVTIGRHELNRDQVKCLHCGKTLSAHTSDSRCDIQATSRTFRSEKQDVIDHAHRVAAAIVTLGKTAGFA